MEGRASGEGNSPAFDESRELLLGVLHAYETYGKDELATPKLQSFEVGRYGSVRERRECAGKLSQAVHDALKMEASLYAN